MRKALHTLNGDEPLNIRSRPKNYDAPPGPFDLREQARTIVDRLLVSKLTASASPEIRSKLDSLNPPFRQMSDEDDEAPGPRPAPAERSRRFCSDLLT